MRASRPRRSTATQWPGRAQVSSARLAPDRDLAQQYLDVADVIFVVIGPDQCVSLINRKGLELLGYYEHEVLGSNWFEHYLPEEDGVRCRDGFLRAIEHGANFTPYLENEIVTRHGERRLIAWCNTALLDELGAFAGSLSSGTDITEQRAAERHMAALMDNSPAMISLKDS